MSKPIIGVVGKPRNLGGRFEYVLISNDVSNKVLRNGGMPVGLLPLDCKHKPNSFEIVSYSLTDFELNNILELVCAVDGVVLQGGLVVNTYEIQIAKLCLKLNKPLLGICCGFDVMLKCTGHDVLLDCENSAHWQMYLDFAHEIVLQKGSFLHSILNVDKLDVNSIHNSTVSPEQINENWRISAICPSDGTVEAIESANNDFAIGLRFHPELLVNCSWTDSIFKKFVLACKKN